MQDLQTSLNSPWWELIKSGQPSLKYDYLGYILHQPTWKLSHLNCPQISYYTLAHSNLIYCPMILCCTSTYNITRIEKLQKKKIRIITKSPYNDRQPLRYSLHTASFICTNSKANQALHFMHSSEYNIHQELLKTIGNKQNTVWFKK